MPRTSTRQRQAPKRFSQEQESTPVVRRVRRKTDMHGYRTREQELCQKLRESVRYGDDLDLENADLVQTNARLVEEQKVLKKQLKQLTRAAEEQSTLIFQLQEQLKNETVETVASQRVHIASLEKNAREHHAKLSETIKRQGQKIMEQDATCQTLASECRLYQLALPSYIKVETNKYTNVGVFPETILPCVGVVCQYPSEPCPRSVVVSSCDAKPVYNVTPKVGAAP